MTLIQAQEGIEYIVEHLDVDDEELVSFLFTLGCYAGQPITVITRSKSNMTLSVKDSRYSIDIQLAGLIFVSEH